MKNFDNSEDETMTVVSGNLSFGVTYVLPKGRRQVDRSRFFFITWFSCSVIRSSPMKKMNRRKINCFVVSPFRSTESNRIRSKLWWRISILVAWWHPTANNLGDVAPMIEWSCTSEAETNRTTTTTTRFGRHMGGLRPRWPSHIAVIVIVGGTRPVGPLRP